jgi:hypothetical protein
MFLLKKTFIRKWDFRQEITFFFLQNLNHYFHYNFFIYVLLDKKFKEHVTLKDKIYVCISIICCLHGRLGFYFNF